MAPILNIAVILAALAFIGLGAYGLAPTLFRSRLRRARHEPTDDDWGPFDEDDLDPGPAIDPALLPETSRSTASFVMPRAWSPAAEAAPLSPAHPPSDATGGVPSSALGPEEDEGVEGLPGDTEDWPEDEEREEVLDIFREVLPARSPGDERRSALLQAEQGRVSMTELLADARLTAFAVLGRASGALQR